MIALLRAFLTNLEPAALPPSPVRPFIGRDRVGVVCFNDDAFTVALPADVHAWWLHQRVSQLPDKLGGTHTNIAAGLRRSIQILEKAPAGALKKIWLLSDGYANAEQGAVMPLVENARRSRIRINTIGFGDPGQFDEVLLRRIAETSPGGVYANVRSLRELSAALVNERARPRSRHRRAEYSVFAVDASLSMKESMEGRRRIDVVREAVIHLLNHKQKVFN